MRHWSDERPLFELRLPVGTIVMAEATDAGLVVWFRPLDQPSARCALAAELDRMAQTLRDAKKVG